MHDSLQSYMKVGIVHFMVYHETMRGEGPILETIEKIALDGFSRDAKIDKRCLIGPSEDALWVARGVRKEQANFSLMVDLSHLPLLGETPRHCLGLLKDHLAHIHIGNCVLKDKVHPAYGDWHPRFGLPGGENDVEELAMFLRELFNVG